MTFKAVKQLNMIGAMKSSTKLNCNVCMEERLTILKNLCDKRVTLMKLWELDTTGLIQLIEYVLLLGNITALGPLQFFDERILQQVFLHYMKSILVLGKEAKS